MKTKTISIYNDFARAPAGRYYPKDGKYPGERFRNEVLVPALRDFDSVVVIFDNETGYGSSFIDEAFGGLVRDAGFKKEWLDEHLRLEATPLNTTYIAEALNDIDAASK